MTNDSVLISHMYCMSIKKLKIFDQLIEIGIEEYENDLEMMGILYRKDAVHNLDEFDKILNECLFFTKIPSIRLLGLFNFNDLALYIKLSQKADKKRINEMELNLDVEIGYEEFESEMELLDLFNVLTEKEAYVMKLIYVHYLSISEVSDFMKVSRQSINQTKNRALKKLRETYLT